MAPGPWIKVPENPGFFTSRSFDGLVECQAIDDSGGKQGLFLGRVLDRRQVEKSEALLIKVIGASDKDYAAWVLEEHGGRPPWRNAETRTHDRVHQVFDFQFQISFFMEVFKKGY